MFNDSPGHPRSVPTAVALPEHSHPGHSCQRVCRNLGHFYPRGHCQSRRQCCRCRRVRRRGIALGRVSGACSCVCDTPNWCCSRRCDCACSHTYIARSSDAHSRLVELVPISKHYCHVDVRMCPYLPLPHLRCGLCLPPLHPCCSCVLYVAVVRERVQAHRIHGLVLRQLLEPTASQIRMCSTVSRGNSCTAVH